MKRRLVKVGNVILGDGNIAIQSMLNVPSYDVKGNVVQAVELERAGCQIIRIAVPSKSDVPLIAALKETLSIPVVADIHFDYRIAIECVAAGADKIRINPGNIGSEDRVKEVVKACIQKNVPIRIGVNSGSVEKDLLAEYGGPTKEAISKSAIRMAEKLESLGFGDIVISVKSSNVKLMVESTRLIHQTLPYPLHLGVTEAGLGQAGLVKSAVGIGALLLDGIGDTIRVSLTEDPIHEIRAAKDILKAVGKGRGVEIIACPTCGRTRIDLLELAQKVEQATSNINKTLKIAVMGCCVNGPGEAKEADFGIAGGDGEGILFAKGKIIKRVKEQDLLKELLLLLS